MVIGNALHARCGDPTLSLTLNGLVDVGERRERHYDVFEVGLSGRDNDTQRRFFFQSLKLARFLTPKRKRGMDSGQF